MDAVRAALRYMRTQHKGIGNDRDTVLVWADQLAELAPADIMPATRAAMRSCRYAPKSADILAAAAELRGASAGVNGSVPPLERTRLPRGEAASTVPVGVWDLALERGVLMACGGDREQARVARNTLQARFGSVDAAMATLTRMIWNARPHLAGVLHPGGMTRWREIADDLPSMAARHWDHLHGRASVQPIDAMVAGLAESGPPPENIDPTNFHDRISP
jgi:hypothetical protein